MAKKVGSKASRPAKVSEKSASLSPARASARQPLTMRFPEAESELFYRLRMVAEDLNASPFKLLEPAIRPWWAVLAGLPLGLQGVGPLV